MAEKHLLPQVFKPWNVLLVVIIGMIYNHVSNLIFTVAKNVEDQHIPNTNVCSRSCAISSGQEIVKSKILLDMSQWISCSSCIAKWSHQNKNENHLACGLRRWIVDKNYLRIHLLNLLPCLSLSVCCVQIGSMFMINWLSNFYSFPCHHPTVAGAAAKQLQIITLLIIVKPKCLFTKTSFTQQIMIFSFQFSFILNFPLLRQDLEWKHHAIHHDLFLPLIGSLVSVPCLCEDEPLLLPKSRPFLLSIFIFELTGILMAVKHFITLFIRSIRWHCPSCHVMSQISCLSCFLMCSQGKTL